MELEALYDSNFVFTISLALLGIFIINNAHRQRSTFLFGLDILVSVFLYMSYWLGDHSVLTGVSIERLIIVLINIQVALFYLVSIYLLKEALQKTKVQEYFFWLFVFPVLVINAYSILFTSEIFVSLDGELTKTSLANVYYLIEILLQVFSIFNFIYLYYSYRKDSYLGKRYFAILFFAGFGVFAGIADSFEEIPVFGFFEILPDYFEYFMYVSGFFLVLLAVLELNAFVTDGRKMLKDFLAYCLTIFVDLLIWLIPVCYLLNKYGSESSGVIVMWSVIMLIFNLFFGDRFRVWLSNKLVRNSENLNYITVEGLIDSMKSLHSSKKSVDSCLLKLEIVQEIAKKRNISRTEAYSEILGEGIEYLKPNHSLTKRTKQTIKYLILEKIFKEGSTESQLLWDLGFESYSKVKTSSTPILAVTSNSEYKATSMITFKRLKREAFEDLAEYVQIQEAKYLRLKL